MNRKKGEWYNGMCVGDINSETEIKITNMKRNKKGDEELEMK